MNPKESAAIRYQEKFFLSLTSDGQKPSAVNGAMKTTCFLRFTPHPHEEDVGSVIIKALTNSDF